MTWLLPLWFSKQYVQMTVHCAYTDQRNELIAALTSHMPFLTPLEVTWRHLNWSQNTFRSVRENIIWSWNPFSKDVLQNVDLTSPPHTFLSLIGPKALQGNRVTQIGRKRARNRRWRLCEPRHYLKSPAAKCYAIITPSHTVIFKWCHSSVWAQVNPLDCWKHFCTVDIADH